MSDFIKWQCDLRLAYYKYICQCAQIIVKELNNAHKRKLAAVGAFALQNFTQSRRFWVSPIIRLREKYGFCEKIMPVLQLEQVGFYNYFRMSATKMEELLIMVGPLLAKQAFLREAIPPKHRLALTLRFLASGDSIHSLHYSYLIGVSTASKIISETCGVLWDVLQPIVLPSVLTTEQWIRIANEFDRKWNFPNCIGAIDGKHINIQCLPHAGSMFFNYKNRHSIVLMAVCDANYKFLFVDIGAYGRRSDGGIFKDSLLGQKLEKNELNIPQPSRLLNGSNIPLPFCLVGDEAFPLKTYLLRPYPGKENAERRKRVFNFRLSRARKIVECVFGILAAVWRIFRREMIASDCNVIKYTQATVALHNWLREDDIINQPSIPYYSPDLLHLRDVGNFDEITRMAGYRSSNIAIQVREEFCRYFNNEGALPWQHHFV